MISESRFHGKRRLKKQLYVWFHTPSMIFWDWPWNKICAPIFGPEYVVSLPPRENDATRSSWPSPTHSHVIWRFTFPLLDYACHRADWNLSCQRHSPKQTRVSIFFLSSGGGESLLPHLECGLDSESWFQRIKSLEREQGEFTVEKPSRHSLTMMNVNIPT